MIDIPKNFNEIGDWFERL